MDTSGAQTKGKIENNMKRSSAPRYIDNANNELDRNNERWNGMERNSEYSKNITIFNKIEHF